MYREKSKFTFKNLLFFSTVWVFYSLNSRYFQIPNAELFRWVFLGLLIIVAYFTGESLALRPPTIVLFFIVAVIPSVILGINQKESFIKFLSFIVVVWGSYIFFDSLETKEESEIALKIMMIVMIAFELQSLLVILSGGMGGPYNGYNGDRMEGNTSNPNTLGIYSNLSFLASYYWFSNTNGYKKLVFFGLMGVSVYTAVASVSRTAFVTICLNIFFCLFIQFRKTGFSFMLLLPVALVLFLAFTGKLDILGIEALNRLSNEGTGRDELWEKGISIWRQYPIFGCGYDVSKYLNYVYENNAIVYSHFHNSYISILAETGLYGVLILGSNLFKNFIPFFKSVKESFSEKRIDIFVFCFIMMISLLITAWSESFLFAVGSTEACTFWMLFTWSLVYLENNKTNYVYGEAKDE